MNPLDLGVDVVAAGLSLTLLYYSIMLLRIFRGGIMDKSFRAFAFSAVFLFVSLSIEVLGNYYPGINPFGYVSDVLTIAFMLVLLYGFYLLSSTWTVKAPQTSAVAKGTSLASEPLR